MSYQQLAQHFRRIAHFEELGSIVHWDQAVNMPPVAGPGRALAVASLARLVHELGADPRIPEWIESARQNELGPWEEANLREISSRHLRATALPADLVEANAKACNESEQAWRKLRAENDFPNYAPYLSRVVDLQRQCAAAYADTLGLDPYDALMDAYEPGMRAETVDRVFLPIRKFLPAFISQVLEGQSAEVVLVPQGPFAVDQQKGLARKMMEAAGLDLTRARIDESHHPFCGGVPNDVRITNRYREDDFLSGLMGVIHESGHGKYEQGLPAHLLDQPVGKARGMVVHESQSLLLEMQVSRGPAFLHFLAGVIPHYFPAQVSKQPQAFTAENLMKLQTRVERGLIRVDADEVTYPAHVMVRYDLERELIAGRLAVPDLPLAWDSKMKEYLGLGTLGNDKDGCLQDVHWPAGAFGYFPLYTLGAMVAAQLFASAQASIGGLDESIFKGDLSPLDAWLKKHIWSQGSKSLLSDLLVAATGEALNPNFFIQHLKIRYGA